MKAEAIKNLSLRKAATFCGTFALAAGLSACGGGLNSDSSSIVSKSSLSTYLSGTDIVAELRTQLDTGNLLIAGLDVPITDKHDPTRVLGHIAIQSSFCGSAICTTGSELVLSVNLTQSAKGSSIVNTLPNGTAIPIGGLGGTPIIGIPIKNNAQLYVGISDKVALMGVALPFKEMDNVGKNLPGVNIFQPFGNNGAGGARGIVGIFTGASAGQSGLALFVDLSTVIHKPAEVAPKTLASLDGIRDGVSSSGAALMRSAAALSGAELDVVREASVSLAPNAQPLQLVEVKPSRKMERKLLMRMAQLNNEGAILNVR